MTILKLRSSVLIALLVIFGLGSARAQSGLADVNGVVSDASGSVVSGATVVLTNTDSGDKRTVVTGSDGRYSIPTVSPGKYSITISAPTFSTESVTGLVIQIDNHVNQNVTLRAGATSEVVNVAGRVSAVDTESYDVGGVVEQEQIDNLPIQNRQYLALALLTPGTTQAASRSFYSNVQSGGGEYFYANGFSWDGVSNQQTEEGDPRQNIPEDSVAEFKTYTANMPADLGWAMGGYTVVATKRGGNSIHGDVFEYFRDTFMTADNFITQQSELASHTGSPPYRRSQFGGSMGGPIFRNRTHYFGAYERTQQTTSWTLYEPAGTAAAADYASLLGTFSAPAHDQLIVGRVDHDLKPNQQLFFRVALEEQLATANGCGGQTTTGCYDGQFPRKAYVGGHTWEPNAKIVNEARFQYAYISYELGPWNTPPPKKPTDFLNPSYTQNVTLSYAFTSLSYGHNYAADGVESRWQVNDSLTIQKGAHSIKVGGDVSYVPYVDASASNLNGTFTFGFDQSFDNSAAAKAALCTTPGGTNCPKGFTQSAVPLLYFLPSTQQAYFIEDAWKARPNLTISAGIRYDLQRGSAFLNTYTPRTVSPTTGNALPVIPGEGDPHKRGDWNNWGPRIGFSWDPSKKARDVIRGGYGVFYNFIETELTEAEKLNFVACSLTINPVSPSTVISYPNPYGTQTVTSFCSTTANTNVTTLSPGFSNPYVHQFSAGYSRQINPSLSLMVDGLYDRGLRDYKIYDLNYPVNYPAVTYPTAHTVTRPNTNMAQIQQHASTGATEYMGLFVKLTKQFSHRYAYTAAYTLSSGHDNNPHSAPIDYNNPSGDWGQAGIDQRQALVFSGQVMVPGKIMVGGILSLRSATPFSVTTTQVTSYTVGGVNDAYGVFPISPNFNATAQFVPGTKRDQGNRNIDYSALNTYRAQLNDHVPPTGATPNAFYKACHTPAAGVAASCLSTNLSAGSVTPLNYKNFDLRVSKYFFQHDQRRLEIIGQAFNLFGRANYTAITTSPVSYTFGAPTTESNAQIGELAAKFTF